MSILEEHRQTNQLFFCFSGCSLFCKSSLSISIHLCTKLLHSETSFWLHPVTCSLREAMVQSLRMALTSTWHSSYSMRKTGLSLFQKTLNSLLTNWRLRMYHDLTRWHLRLSVCLPLDQEGRSVFIPSYQRCRIRDLIRSRRTIIQLRYVCLDFFSVYAVAMIRKFWKHANNLKAVILIVLKVFFRVTKH